MFKPKWRGKECLLPRSCSRLLIEATVENRVGNGMCSDHEALAEIPLDLDFTMSLIDDLDIDFDFDLDDLVLPSDVDLGILEDAFPSPRMDVGDSEPSSISNSINSCSGALEPLELGDSVEVNHLVVLDHGGPTADALLKTDDANLRFEEDDFPGSCLESGCSDPSLDSNRLVSGDAGSDPVRLGIPSTEPLDRVLSVVAGVSKMEDALPSPESGFSSEGNISIGSCHAPDCNVSDTGNPASCSPESSCIPSVTGGIDWLNPISPLQAEAVRVGVKRKMETREDFLLRRGEEKLQRPEGNSSAILRPVNENEEKRKTRLVRNRESAQLSRERKKHYVEDLENKVKCMSATIAELNNRIVVMTSENASLRQQLASACSQPYAFAPPPNTQFAFPVLPYASALVAPQIGTSFFSGSKVPLFPISRTKMKQSPGTPKENQPSSKMKSSEHGKKSGRTSKKIASVTFICFLFFLMYFGGLFSVFNFMSGRSKDIVRGRFGYVGSGVETRLRDRDLLDFNNKGPDILREFLRERHIDSLRNDPKGRRELSKECSSLPFYGYDDPNIGGNISDSMVASLFIPTNNKLVHIDGKLVIQSILAAERSRELLKSKPGEPIEKVVVSGALKAEENGLVTTKSAPPALPVAVYRSPVDHQRVVASDSRGNYVDNPYPSPSFDVPFQKLFHQGISGNIFRSGTCTEVFRFEVSPTSTGNQSTFFPSASFGVSNSSTSIQRANLTSSGMIKNRRFLYQSNPSALPLPVRSLSDATSDFSKNSSKDDLVSSSMVVSVLPDPREGSDMFSSTKSFPRILVVVLVDGVKYITYSCMLSFKNSPPFL